MNKADLIKIVAAAGLNKQEAECAVNTVFSAITDELAKGGSVTVKDFGSFKTIIKGAHEEYNPVTHEKIEITPNKIVVFKAGQELNDKIKKRNS